MVLIWCYIDAHLFCMFCDYVLLIDMQFCFWVDVFHCSHCLVVVYLSLCVVLWMIFILNYGNCYHVLFSVCDVCMMYVVSMSFVMCVCWSCCLDMSLLCVEMLLIHAFFIVCISCIWLCLDCVWCRVWFLYFVFVLLHVLNFVLCRVFYLVLAMCLCCCMCVADVSLL